MSSVSGLLLARFQPQQLEQVTFVPQTVTDTTVCNAPKQLVLVTPVSMNSFPAAYGLEEQKRQTCIASSIAGYIQASCIQASCVRGISEAYRLHMPLTTSG